MKKIIVFVMLSISAVLPSYGMTAADIFARARVYLKDQSSIATRQQFSDALLLKILNDGQQEFVSNTWALETKVYVTLANGTIEYTLPSNHIGNVRVLINNKQVYQTTQFRLDAEVSSWRTSSGTPSSYYLSFTTVTNIGFYPVPDDVYIATVTYAQSANDLTSISQTPFNSYANLYQYHSGLIYYVTCRGYQSLEEDALAQPFCAEWLAFLKSAQKGLMNRPDFYPVNATPQGATNATGQ
jgi:hypothetical protein